MTVAAQSCYTADVAVCHPANVGQFLDTLAHPVCQRLNPASGDRHGGVFTGFEEAAAHLIGQH